LLTADSLTGDLTDAKDKILGSQQYEEEWRAYQTALVETRVINKTKWLDIRGNHDNFNVEFLYDGKTDLFRNFSVQGKNHKRSYLHQENVDGVTYNFLALDASIEPGTKRPYNFIGMVPGDELKRVEDMLRNSPANYTVWFAHYPTSTIMTPSGSDHIRKFIGKFDESSIFVAGHLHTLGGLAFRMYALQPEGFLELELGDFMKNRRFRVGVFDHGLFSFADVKLGTWPIAVITNPKNILFNNPFKEDINLQLQSTHIRIVAFSTSEIVQCKVRINDGQWMNCEKKTENFFAVPWNPTHYSHGKHEMELVVGDADGRIFHKIQTFALDGSRKQFDLMARFILMSDITTVFQLGFFGAFVLCLLPLVTFKTWQLMIKCKLKFDDFK
jgi:Icc-related predicted phosphoesterase